MYIRRIVLENIKGVEELDFQLTRPDGTQAGWTVFTGDNGSGKTALLKAVSLALVGLDASRALQPSMVGWLRVGSAEGVIALELVHTDDDDSFQSSGKTTKAPFWAEYRLNGGGRVPVLDRGTKYSRKRKTAGRGPWAEDPSGWFSCGYGPFRRTAGTSPEAQRLMATPGKIERFVTLFREDAALSECENWLKELKFRSELDDASAKEKLELVVSILDDDLLQNRHRIERIDADGLWLRDAGDRVLPMSDLSDGYRAALALMADILRHLIAVFGVKDLASKTQDGGWTVNRSGVILIDEIDVHLHPAWQRTIGFWLKEHLPRMQFLVTTHSPLICQCADPHGLFHLPAPGTDSRAFRVSEEDRRLVVAAKADNVLLSPAFALHHTRSPRAVQGRQRHAELRAKEAGPGLLPAESAEKRQLEFEFMREE